MQAWLKKHRLYRLITKTWISIFRHDKWLCMMWPRLHLLHELLSDDGVIFISIDDNEVHNLRLLMDEIFLFMWFKFYCLFADCYESER